MNNKAAVCVVQAAAFLLRFIVSRYFQYFLSRVRY